MKKDLGMRLTRRGWIVLLAATIFVAMETPTPWNTTPAVAAPSAVEAKAPAAAAARCTNDLAALLADIGFEGENLREAWAIAMRESTGDADVISRTNDYGLFQFNRATYGKADWWHSTKLRTAGYNAKIAFELSKGGKTWYAWGLDGRGRPNTAVYENSGWSDKQITEWILKPYKKWYEKFADLPAGCQALAYPGLES